MAYGDLATFDAVKQFLQVSHGQPPSDDWDMLARMITQASSLIHSYLSRWIPIADYEEICDGTGGCDLIFANYPVLSVASVNIDSRDVPPSPDRISYGYLFRDTKLTLRGRYFSRGSQNVVIQYTAGYRAVPAEIEQACIELVALRYRERSRLGIIQENIVNVDSHTYRLIDMLPQTRAALNQFKNVVPISASSRRLAPTQTDPTVIGAVL